MLFVCVCVCVLVVIVLEFDTEKAIALLNVFKYYCKLKYFYK